MKRKIFKKLYYEVCLLRIQLLLLLLFIYTYICRYNNYWVKLNSQILTIDISQTLNASEFWFKKKTWKWFWLMCSTSLFKKYYCNRFISISINQKFNKCKKYQHYLYRKFLKLLPEQFHACIICIIIYFTIALIKNNPLLYMITICSVVRVKKKNAFTIHTI